MKTNTVWWKTLVALVCAGALLQLAVWPAAAAPQASSFSLPGNQPAGVTAKLQPAGSPDLSQPVTLAIGLKLPNPEGLQAAVAAAKRERAAALTPQQFLDAYAPTGDDYQAVVDWLTEQGFSVQTSPNRLLVLATGTLGQAAGAFKVTTGQLQPRWPDLLCQHHGAADPHLPVRHHPVGCRTGQHRLFSYLLAPGQGGREAVGRRRPGSRLDCVRLGCVPGPYTGSRPSASGPPMTWSPCTVRVDGTGQTIDIAIWNAIDPQRCGSVRL